MQLPLYNFTKKPLPNRYKLDMIFLKINVITSNSVLSKCKYISIIYIVTYLGKYFVKLTKTDLQLLSLQSKKPAGTLKRPTLGTLCDDYACTNNSLCSKCPRKFKFNFLINTSKLSNFPKLNSALYFLQIFQTTH